MDLGSGFHVDLIFPDEYTDFIAEIYHKDRLVFVISQESGFENAEVEFSTDVRGSPEKMSLSGLEAAIAYSKKRLFELGK